MDGHIPQAILTAQIRVKEFRKIVTKLGGWGRQGWNWEERREVNMIKIHSWYKTLKKWIKWGKQSSSLPTSSPEWTDICFLNDWHCGWGKKESQCSFFLTFISLIASIIIYLLATCVLSFENCVFISFTHLLKGLINFSCIFFLCVFYVIILHHMLG